MQQRPEQGMKLYRAAIALTCGWLVSAGPSIGSEYKSSAEQMAATIRSKDPLVAEVKTHINAKAGLKTGCGETKDEKFEAFYCGKDGGVIVISSKALENIGRSFGEVAVVAVVAHEFGHARQHKVGGFTRNTIWTGSVDELQADCVAGVYLANYSPVTITEEKLDKASEFMKEMGSYIFIERDWHGSPEMRSASLRYGFRAKDLGKCLATKENNWGKIGETIDREIEAAPDKVDKLLKWGQDILK